MEWTSGRDDNASELDCAAAREAISADIDGEDVPAGLDDHLTGCAECTAYRERVVAMARSTRVRPVSTDTAFVDAVMERAQPVRLGRHGWLRPALAWCGLLVAFQSIDPLVFGNADGAPEHIARHLGASILALAFGLLFVAWRPHRAAGLLPFVAALFVAMFVSAAFDVAGGQRSVLSESVHLSELIGLVLVWMIAGSPGWDRVSDAFRRDQRGAAPSTS